MQQEEAILFQPFQNYFGGIGPNDGTVDFYLRVASLSGSDKTLLDLGAGRAGWLETDASEIRRNLRLVCGKFQSVIAADVDPAVRDNRASDKQILIQNGHVPLDDETIDVVVSDYVLEHISDPREFSVEVDRLLVPGGWFCARTPHFLNYIALASRAMSGRAGDRIVAAAQPTRMDEDIFPKTYKMNDVKTINKIFPNYENFSYLRRADPAYFFGNKFIYHVLDYIHRATPAQLSGNIFVFLRKPEK